MRRLQFGPTKFPFGFPVILAAVLSFAFCSCEKDGPNADKPVDFSLVVRGLAFDSQNSPGSAESIGEFSLYQFSDGVLYKHANLTPDKDSRVPISGVVNTTLYCIANATFEAQDLTTRESDFRESVIESLPGANSAPYFLAATAEIDSKANSGNKEITVSMKHGVARIDLNTAADSKTRITEFIIENAPAATYPFIENSMPGEETTVYSKKYDPAFNGVDNAAFYVFESTVPVTATVRGTYNGIPIRIRTEIPAVERNKIYELEIVNSGATVTGEFEIKDWEEGETVTGKPDTDRKISVSEKLSEVPEGVKIDPDHNIVEVPASGVSDMTLAFVSDSRIEISSIEDKPENVTLSGMSVKDTSEGIVSSFRVSVPKQTNGRLGYSIFVHLRNALLSGSYDFLEIRVAPSEHQIETVEIGGCVWMAFNATGQTLEEQVYTLDGLTVEEMYQKNWINTVGGLFQFGRRFMYIPWVGYNPSNNLGNQTQDIPWQSASHIPCPEGYRLPTRAELESMFPKGTTIPGKYVAGNGEHITATLHTAEGTLSTPSGVTGTQRYVKFTSEETGRSLFIPLAGSKGDKSTSNNPAFGKRAVIWTDSNQGCPGGHALTYTMKFENDETTVISEDRLQMEAFASVRCVKISK